jgi:hypothetical protein
LTFDRAVEEERMLLDRDGAGAGWKVRSYLLVGLSDRARQSAVGMIDLTGEPRRTDPSRKMHHHAMSPDARVGAPPARPPKPRPLSLMSHTPGLPAFVQRHATVMHADCRLAGSVIGQNARILRDVSVARAIRLRVAARPEVAPC